jgi:hypothetical protein
MTRGRWAHKQRADGMPTAQSVTWCAVAAIRQDRRIPQRQSPLQNQKLAANRQTSWHHPNTHTVSGDDSHLQRVTSTIVQSQELWEAALRAHTTCSHTT